MRQREITRRAVMQRHEAGRQRDHRIEHAHRQRGGGSGGLNQPNLAEQAIRPADLAALGQQDVTQLEVSGKAPPQGHPGPGEPEQKQAFDDRQVGERSEEIEPGRLRRSLQRHGQRRGHGPGRRLNRSLPDHRIGGRRCFGEQFYGRGWRRLGHLGCHPRGKRDGGQHQPRRRDQPQGVCRLGAEMLGDRAPQHQHQRDQYAGPRQRVQQHPGHGRSSFSSASISARSSSVRASVSARCATSEAALPPNRRSTSRRDSPPT